MYVLYTRFIPMYKTPIPISDFHTFRTPYSYRYQYEYYYYIIMDIFRSTPHDPIVAVGVHEW